VSEKVVITARASRLRIIERLLVVVGGKWGWRFGHGMAPGDGRMVTVGAEEEKGELANPIS
jgi:hypothetical protein